MNPTKRSIFHDYYANTLNKSNERFDSVVKSAADSKYQFKGEKVENAAVVRADINGYSAWSKDKPIADRVDLLKEFFSHLIPGLDQTNGIYFRDEGDCLVAIFSPYFQPVNYHDITTFCMHAVGRRYGKSNLSAKCTISTGKLAFFQKPHELGTDDWSAEGQAFVNVARLEAAVESKPRICFFSSEYTKHYDPYIPKAQPGGKYNWEIIHEPLQIQGLGLTGGWEDITYLEHRP